MFGFSTPSLVIILLIVLVVFGAGRLPEVGNALGRSIRNFKKATDENEEIEDAKRRDQEKRGNV